MVIIYIDLLFDNLNLKLNLNYAKIKNAIMIKKIKQIIKGYVMWFWYYFNKTYRNKRKEEAERRIKICESCEFFWKPGRNCMICGCFMDVKTKMELELDDDGISRNGCLMKKW